MYSHIHMSSPQPQFPMARYEQDSVYCLAWPLKNHAAATCTNQFIPDTETSVWMWGQGTRTAGQESEVQDWRKNGRRHTQPYNKHITQAHTSSTQNTTTYTQCCHTSIPLTLLPPRIGIELNNNFGAHINGQIDCLGFQRTPKFCDRCVRACIWGRCRVRCRVCCHVCARCSPIHRLSLYLWCV